MTSVKYCTQPKQCYACKRLFLPNKRIINHHVTYFPEYIVQIHPSCHTKIHSQTGFSQLLPDIRQTMRWYRKLGKQYRTDLFDWEFADFWDRLWFTSMSQIEQEKWRSNLLDQYWKRCAEITQAKENLFFSI